MCFYLLRLLIVDLGEMVSRFTLCMQQLLGLYRLGIAMLRPLDKKCHAKCQESDPAVEVERLSIENQPRHGVDDDKPESGRTRHQVPTFVSKVCNAFCTRALLCTAVD